MRKVFARLGSPAGFGLALLLFLVLPFVSVSCDLPGIGSAGANYTGGDVAFDSEPKVQVPDLGDLGAQIPGDEDSDEPPPSPDAQLLAIIAAALLAVGIGTVAITRVRARLLASAGVALLAGGALVATQAVAQDNLTAAVLAEAAKVDAGPSPLGDLEGRIADLVTAEPPFWVTLLLLAAIAAANILVLVRMRT